MTKEEKINTLKAIIQECEEYQWQRKEILFEIIKDLEQEPTTKNDLSSEIEKNSKKLEKDFGELDCISRQALLNATVKKSSIWNHITNSEGDNLEAIVSKLPSVTPIRPKGHWVNKSHSFESCSAECSACHNRSNGYMHDNGFSLECKYYDFCPKCGADMRGNTIRKGKPIEGNNESYNCENWIP